MSLLCMPITLYVDGRIFYVLLVFVCSSLFCFFIVVKGSTKEVYHLDNSPCGFSYHSPNIGYYFELKIKITLVHFSPYI